LRKVLGDDRDLIRTEFGRGYRFTAAIRSTAAAPERRSAPDATEAPAGTKAASPPDLSAVVAQLARLEAKLAEALHLLATHQTVSKRNTNWVARCTASSGRKALSCNLRDMAAQLE
jgi:hypothetical protein